MTRTSAAAPTARWRSRIVGSGEEAPDQLLANPANWRIHPKAQQDALAGALDQVSWVQQVLVNQRSGFVVDGHARVALAITRGEPTVPVLYVDLSPEEEALVLATLDPIGAMATRDDEKLQALLAGITVDDAGLLALLGDLRGAKASLTDPDEVPETPEEPYVKPGDLYVLGDHRILCGDATSADDVARLLDGAAPTLLATDPPYGVSLDPTCEITCTTRSARPRSRTCASRATRTRPSLVTPGWTGRTPTPSFPSGPGTPDLDVCWRAYLRRFDIEHTYRFVKNTLGWTAPALRTPEQADRWTWLIVAAYTQLRLARGLVADQRLPWERPCDPAKLTPVRVRRGFRRLRAMLGTPASPRKYHTAGPGRPKGTRHPPRTRYPPVKKAA